MNTIDKLIADIMANLPEGEDKFVDAEDITRMALQFTLDNIKLFNEENFLTD